MKKMLRKELLLLLYALAAKEIKGSGEDVSKEIEHVFNMLAMLVNEEIMREVIAKWEFRNDGLVNAVGAPEGEELYDAQMYRLMKFDREVRMLFIENKLI